MKNKKIMITFFVIIVAFIILLKLTIKKYSIDDDIRNLNLKTELDKKIYYATIINYIEPKKLSNFVNYTDMNLTGYSDKANGYTILDDIKYEAYRNLFVKMFDKNKKNFDDCPVTKNFTNKFNDNLFKFFKFENKEDSFVSCSIDRQNFILDVTEAGDFVAGEPNYIFYHHFHYILDDEGNVDDIIYDYTE